jgi:hypothetical protein
MTPQLWGCLIGCAIAGAAIAVHRLVSFLRKRRKSFACEYCGENTRNRPNRERVRLCSACSYLRNIIVRQKCESILEDYEEQMARFLRKGSAR